MATAIKMPDLGTNVEEIRLIEWLKQEGEFVRRGESLCEVETDKATDDLECAAEGVLLRQMVPAGSQIAVGSVIAYVGQPGESVPEPPSPPSPVPQAKEESDVAPSRPAVEPQAAEGSQESVPRVAPSRVPLVIRNLAEREGVDLAKVVGTGPGGQITRDDVVRAKTSTAAEDDHGVPLAKEQLAVARQVSRSNREIPTIDLTATVEMSAVMRLRKRGPVPPSDAAPAGPVSSPLAYDSFFLYAVAQAIKRFRAFAAHGGDDRLYPHASIDVCLAVSRDTRLYLPVVRSADRLSLAEIDAEVRRLVEKTRGGQLRPDDLSGGCFTVSNLGMYGIDSFQMIIPPGQSGALAVGAVQQRAIPKDGKIVLCSAATVVLSVDHRMINGALAAEFLKHLKEILETL